jgi:hypothetical protein
MQTLLKIGPSWNRTEMDFFEYLMVMVSIVLGLGTTQLLRGLGKIVRGERGYWFLSLCGGRSRGTLRRGGVAKYR